MLETDQWQFNYHNSNWGSKNNWCGFEVFTFRKLVWIQKKNKKKQKHLLKAKSFVYLDEMIHFCILLIQNS